MPKTIHFAKITLTLFMPVCSRTQEEAAEIAQEVLGDFLSTRLDDLPEAEVEFDESQPEEIEDDETVWGEATPEDHCEVGTLRAHLAGEGKGH